MASNWVIPGVLMAGAYPGALEDRQNDLQLKCILNKGVDTFVCLQAEVDNDTPEHEWRSGAHLRPYLADAKKLSKKPLIWRHLPILDGGVAPDDLTEALICDLLDDVRAGRIIYVHCWGGHGRTGTIACLMLAVLYSVSYTETIKRVQFYHDCRKEPQGVKSPSTVVQRKQVKRLLQTWEANSQPSKSLRLSGQEVQAEHADGGPSSLEVGIESHEGNKENVGVLMRRSCSSKQVSGPQTVTLHTGFHAKSLRSHPGGWTRSSSALMGPRLHQPVGPLATRGSIGTAAGRGATAVEILRKSAGKLSFHGRS
jgi:hypothetical protein